MSSDRADTDETAMQLPGKPASDRSVNLQDTATGEFLSVRGLIAHVRVDGPLACTALQITFVNDLSRTLEADLVFPLPPLAALVELDVRTGKYALEGKIKGRARAQAEYQRAVRAGQTAALGESEGEDLARIRIAPIASGDDVEVVLIVEHTLLPISDGHRLIVPLTYMPRFVEDPAKLKETERAAVDRPRPPTLAARADVEVSIAHPTGHPPKIRCVSHSTTTTSEAQRTVARVSGVALDQDLQLEIVDRPKGSKPALWVRHDPSRGPDELGPTTAVAVMPPQHADEGPTQPRTVLFLVDRSGSMQGGPMAAAIRAVRGSLRALGPDDRFNVIAFDDMLEALAPWPVPFDDAMLAAADRFISAIDARGGTSASMALAATLEDTLRGASVIALPQAPPLDVLQRLRVVVFMTDGDVAGASSVLETATSKLGETRIHVLGIGSSVHHAMLAELARLGGGAYTPVVSDEDLEQALVRLKNAIYAPLWTGIRVMVERDGERKKPALAEPSGVLDLFAGEPLLVAFRGAVDERDHLVLEGSGPGGEDLALSVTLDEALAVARAEHARAEREGTSALLASQASTVWALLRNRRLTYRFNPEDDDTLEALGTNFGLVNRRTSLVGVNPETREEVVSGSVAVSLPLPENVAHGLVGGGGPGGPARYAMAIPKPAPSMTSFAPRAQAPMGPSAMAPSGMAPSGMAPPAMAAPPPASRPFPVPVAPSPAQPGRSGPPSVSPHAGAPVAPPAPPLSDDEAGLRALLLRQRANGYFNGDLTATVAALAALVSRGHTAREGLFRAELRRTLMTLKSQLATLSGDDRVLAALGLAFLVAPHGDDLPDELPAPIAAHLEGVSLLEPKTLQSQLGAALRAAPVDASKSPLAAEVLRVFFGG